MNARRRLRTTDVERWLVRAHADRVLPMEPDEFAAALREAFGHPWRRAEVSRADCERYAIWDRIQRRGVVTLDGRTVLLVEAHDRDTDERWIAVADGGPSSSTG